MKGVIVDEGTETMLLPYVEAHAGYFIRYIATKNSVSHGIIYGFLKRH